MIRLVLVTQDCNYVFTIFCGCVFVIVFKACDVVRVEVNLSAIPRTYCLIPFFEREEVLRGLIPKPNFRAVAAQLADIRLVQGVLRT